MIKCVVDQLSKYDGNGYIKSVNDSILSKYEKKNHTRNPEIYADEKDLLNKRSF